MTLTKSRIQPLVTIVTPTLNQASFLSTTLNSVRDQTYPRIEHIVIDGGSTDETLNILREYEPQYNMRWLSAPDTGMYDAVNKGLNLASGDILAYLNSDDFYLPWTVSTVVDAFQSRSDVEFIYGDMLNMDAGDKLASPVIYTASDIKVLDFRGFIGQPSVFWTRSAFQKTGSFNAKLQFAGDTDYWLRLRSLSAYHKINEFLAVDTNHSQTKRYTGQIQLDSEMACVRDKYQERRPRWKKTILRLHATIKAVSERRVCLIRLYVAYVSMPKVSRHLGWSEALSPESGISLDSKAILGAAFSLGSRANTFLQRSAEFDPIPSDPTKHH